MLDGTYRVFRTSAYQLTGVQLVRRRNLVYHRPQYEWRAYCCEVKAVVIHVEGAISNMVPFGRRRNSSHLVSFSWTKFQAALSARVLLARYQCILQASFPFSLTSLIDTWFQSVSLKVATGSFGSSTLALDPSQFSWSFQILSISGE